MSDLIGSSESLRIAENTEVTLHFSILLATGDEVDSTRRGKPAVFVVGDGNLLPGFESALFGMTAGGDAQLKIRRPRRLVSALKATCSVCHAVGFLTLVNSKRDLLFRLPRLMVSCRGWFADCGMKR